MFKEKSREKRKEARPTKKKAVNGSRKHSEDKENIMYYVHRKNNKNIDEGTEKYKSRSRSRREKGSQPKEICPQPYDPKEHRFVRQKESVLKTFSKKSNSTKTILHYKAHPIRNEHEKR